MNLFHPDQASWLAQVQESIIDPEREIIDPHHHLWPDMRGDVYNVDEFAHDTGSGHKVVGSVFIECATGYRSDGPENEQSLGETEYVLRQAARIKELGLATPLLGMVGHVDLRLGDALDDILDKHIDLAGSFFKGIRDAGASAKPEDHEHLLIPGPAPIDLYLQPAFQQSVRRLGARGLTYDTWHYHYQTRDFIALAKACPDTVLVLDHFGTPLGVGPYAAQRDAVFAQWRADLQDLGACPNVVLKLGGLAMPDNGFGWHVAERPPGTPEFIASQGHYYQHALQCFGPERCMFESNFPVDRMSMSYHVLYNALKTIVHEYSEHEKNRLFAGTARQVYQLTD